MGFEFGILRLQRGAVHKERTTKETVLVLLDGTVAVAMNREKFSARRVSLFDEQPSAFHCGSSVELSVKAKNGEAELAVLRVANSRALPVCFHAPDGVATEDRGAGLAQGACRRLVRTIFDHSSRPDSNLVVGEVVNLPGRWSSYPGHHHPQPEVYHYRFTLPQGYGHAEIGESVV
jgi:5-deoxy-glucuronate isomerase